MFKRIMTVAVLLVAVASLVHTQVPQRATPREAAPATAQANVQSHDIGALLASTDLFDLHERRSNQGLCRSGFATVVLLLKVDEKYVLEINDEYRARLERDVMPVLRARCNPLTQITLYHYVRGFVLSNAGAFTYDNATSVTGELPLVVFSLRADDRASLTIPPGLQGGRHSVAAHRDRVTRVAQQVPATQDETGISARSAPRTSPPGADAPMDDKARAALDWFGAELTPFKGVSGGSALFPLLGLRVGRMDPGGPAAQAGIYTSDVLFGVYEPDPNMPFAGFIDSHTRSQAAFGRFLARFGEGAKVALQVKLEKDTVTSLPDYTRVTHAIVTLAPANRAAFVERPRPPQMTQDLDRNRAIALYMGWYEAFKMTETGRKVAEANLKPATPRGSLAGKEFLTYMPNGVSLYYDDRLCNNLSREEVDVYAATKDPAPRISDVLTQPVVRYVKGGMASLCTSASRITLFLMSGDTVVGEYRIVPEGQRGGLWEQFINSVVDYAWALDDATVPAEQRPSVLKHRFDPTKYAYAHTIQNIIDGRLELVRANQFIAGNLGNMFAHYAVAYGRSSCVKDPTKYKLTVTTTTTQRSAWGVFMGTWTNTRTDEVTLDRRHAKDFDDAFDARTAVINPINAGMWEDMLTLFSNHPCSSPVHAVFESNLQALRSGAR